MGRRYDRQERVRPLLLVPFFLVAGTFALLFWLPWGDGASSGDTASPAVGAGGMAKTVPSEIAAVAPSEREQRVPSAPSDPAGSTGSTRDDPEDATAGEKLGVPESIEVRGRVVDARTGSGIPDAEVFLNSPVRPGSKPRTVRTDAQGIFSLGRAGWGEIGSVAIRAEGYRFGLWFAGVFLEDFSMPADDRVEILPRDDHGLRFPLEPGARLFGTVVDGAGVPVTQGYVFAYEPYVVRYVMDPVGDTFSTAAFFHDGIEGHPNPVWEAFSTPFALLDDQGGFELTCLPANQEMSLLVYANDVRREILDTISLPPGEDEVRTIVVKRICAIPGRLIPPEGRSAREFGLWACIHADGECMTPDGFDPSCDLWIPVQENGSFVAGPLEAQESIVLRVSYSTPVPPHHAEIFSSSTMSLESSIASGMFLEVDLQQADHFRLIEHR